MTTKKHYLHVMRKKLFCDLVEKGESHESALQLAYDSNHLNAGHLKSILQCPYVRMRLSGTKHGKSET